ncbi:MAG: HNH endonuclease [Proteobacteria bacterium]|nr:HNH endonuclease [Pseudomonadota bacterium]MBU4288971.1 HNH endonuclease [Pseudomonadota bacterium]MBU4414528.1 HNH endonuclease [Pseudomonadota bacterium]MCG2758725.1 HNH endonuclease [Desulfobacteraceae bacterium]
MKENDLKPFAFDLDEKDIRRERSKARELRASQWWKRQLAKGVCYYCGKQTPPKELTMDHIVPISRGGRSTKSNVVTSCKECNNKKKHLLPMEWEEYLKDIS